jgi:hypothetical protein
MLSARPSLSAALREGGDFLRLAEDTDDQVDQVAAELKHDAAGILGQPLPLIRGNALAHHCLDLEGLPQPAVGQELPHQHDRRVVAIHVAHLD